MECPRAYWFVVLTLLQLCRASYIPHRWYSAKLNDQPRPASESYPEPVFSTSRPIIVSSTSNAVTENEYNDYVSSTMSPPPFSSTRRPDFTETNDYRSTTLNFRQSRPNIRPSTQEFRPSTPFRQTTSGLSQSTSDFTKQTTWPNSRIPSTSAPLFTSEGLPSHGVKNVFVSKPDILETVTTPLPPLYDINENIHQLHNHRQMDLQRQHQRAYDGPQIQSYVPYAGSLQPLLDGEPQLQMVSEIPTQVQKKLHVRQNIEPIGQTFAPSLPVNNLFLTQTTPAPVSEPIEAGSNFGDNSPSSTPTPTTQFEIVYTPSSPATFPPVYSSETPTSVSTSSSTFGVTPSTFSTPLETSDWSSTRGVVPISQTTSVSTTFSTRRPTSRFPATRNPAISSSSFVTSVPCRDQGFSTARPLTGTVGSLKFPLKIRVLAPSGSITNVLINPATVKPKPTTKRTTTTRKPTTKRTNKPKKNSYDRCLDGCKKVKDPICAAPLAHIEIDPKTLRGFPSVCHMACHNSYRNTPFEKVLDGSCSKVRTRIRPIDSRNKLSKVELVKTQYVVDPSEPQTIVELVGEARHKK